MIRRKFKVSGRVQGVYFRASTEKFCREYGISGFVRNEADGSVYIEAEATTDLMKKLRTWLDKGPVMARVDDVEEEEIPVLGDKHFEIRRE